MVNRGWVRVAVQVVSFRPKHPARSTIFRFADTKMAHKTLAIGDYKESKPYRVSVNAQRSQVGCDVRGTIGGAISTSCVNHVVKVGESGVSLVSVKLPEPNTISPTDFLRYVFYMMTTTIAVVRDSSPEVYYPNNVFHDEDSVEDRSTSFFRKDVGLFLEIRRPVNPVNPDDRFKVESLSLIGPLDVMKDAGQVVDEFGLGIDESGLLPRFPMTPVVLLDPKNGSSDEEFSQCLFDAREVAQWLSDGSSWYGLDVCRHLKEECMCYDCLNQTGRTGIRMSDLF
jgi:hypothetical protein